MHKLAEGEFNLMDLHTFTGQLALWLMLAHAIWATLVIRKSLESMKKRFHKFSIFVWLVWLFPYFGGMIVAMSH